MALTFSGDLRTRVLSASRYGMSARSAAARFGIGASTAIAWIAKGRQGQMTPVKQGRPSGSRLDTQADCIATVIAAQKDITRNEVVLRLRQDKRRSRSVAVLLLFGYAHVAGRLKKDRTCSGARTSGSDKAASRLVR